MTNSGVFLRTKTQHSTKAYENVVVELGAVPVPLLKDQEAMSEKTTPLNFSLHW